MTSVTRAELLDTASMKLAEVVLLLTEAGEKRLAREAGELAQQVEASALTSEVTLHIALSGAAGAKVPRLQLSKRTCRSKRA